MTNESIIPINSIIKGKLSVERQGWQQQCWQCVQTQPREPQQRSRHAHAMQPVSTIMKVMSYVILLVWSHYDKQIFFTVRFAEYCLPYMKNKHHAKMLDDTLLQRHSSHAWDVGCVAVNMGAVNQDVPWLPPSTRNITGMAQANS